MVLDKTGLVCSAGSINPTITVGTPRQNCQNHLRAGTDFGSRKYAPKLCLRPNNDLGVPFNLCLFLIRLGPIPPLALAVR
jgi:hypothetical protein